MERFPYILGRFYQPRAIDDCYDEIVTVRW